MYTTYSVIVNVMITGFLKKDFGNLQHNDLFYNVLACQLYS